MSLIYLDEELPEIEVREIITAEEFMQDVEFTDQKTGLNIYKPEEIYNQFFLLLQKLKDDSAIPIRQKAHLFQQLHNKVIQETLPSIPGTIIPEVALQRQDNGDEDEFFEKLEEAKKHENYDVRRHQLEQVFLGLETTEEDKKPILESAKPVEVLLKDSGNDTVVVLPKDRLQGSVYKLYTKKGISYKDPAFEELNLVDKISSKKPVEEYVKEIDREIGLYENIDLSKKSTEEVIDSITDVSSIYSLWKEFIQYRINLNTLSKQDIEILETKLRDLQSKNKEVFTFIKAVKDYKPSALDFEENYGIYAFYVVQKEIFAKLSPILDKLQNHLLELYQLFLDSTPLDVLDPSKLPGTAFDIAMMVYDNKITLEEVVDLLKYQLIHEQRKVIESWLKAVSDWKVDKIEQKVESELQMCAKSLVSILNDPNYKWSSVIAEIKNTKKGEIIARDREEGPTLDNVFLLEEGQDFLLEKDDPEALDLPDYDDNLPVELSSFDEGLREISSIVIRMYVIMQRVSGLPLDFEKMKDAIPSLLRKTKKVQIKEALPELSDELQTLLNNNEIADNLDEVIENIIDPSLYQRARTSLTKIYKEFKKDVETLWLYMLAWWICDLQNHVVNRTLQFEIWKGALDCINIWTPYGPPLEGLKMKKEGVIPYLLCIIYNLSTTEGTLWDQYAKGVHADDITNHLWKLFETDMKDKVSELQERFKTFEKELPTKNLQDKGEKVKRQIVNTVEQREKNRYLSDYMYFLKNLPSVLVQSSIAKKLHIGCCLQLLSEKYKSDYDWASYVKEAYKIKKLFATQRIGLDKRPHIVHVTRKAEEKPEVSIIDNSKYLEKPVFEAWTLQKWIDSLETYMPIQDYQKLKNEGVLKLLPVIEKNLGIFANTGGSQLGEFVLQSDTQTLFEFYRKIIQTQYTKIQKEFIDKRNEYDYLSREFHLYLDLYNMLLESDIFSTENQDMIRKRVLQYFISRQLCFPSKPEFARNNTLVLLTDNLEASLLPTFIDGVVTPLKEWCLQKGFNKSVNYTEYIGKMREQENATKLRIIDIMNPDERKIYVQAKKLGILELQDYLGEFKQKLEEAEELQEEVLANEEEDEFYPKRGWNDDEVDIDSFHDDEF